MTETRPSLQRIARASGLFYVVILLVGMFSPIVLETLVVPGEPAATAENILGSRGIFAAGLGGWIAIVVVDVILSVLLYLLLEPVSRTLSLVSGAFRLLYSVVLAAFLLLLFRGYTTLTDVAAGGGAGAPELHAAALADFEAFSMGFTLGLVFFGVHLIVLGGLVHRSGYLPRLLGVLLVVAGVGYVANGFGTFFVPAFGATASTVLLMPALVAEVGLAGWLVVKGVGEGAGAR